MLQNAGTRAQPGDALFVLASACDSRLPRDRGLALQCLWHDDAAIISSAFEWLDSRSRPDFKAMLAMLKRSAMQP